MMMGIELNITNLVPVAPVLIPDNPCWVIGLSATCTGVCKPMAPFEDKGRFCIAEAKREKRKNTGKSG